ncbi:MAG: hypothetical protein HFJ59_04695 [Clostridia bacterium]|nr:hypothetical protein [Clostridia bacterium]
MKFKNKITSSILEPNSKFVEEQMRKSDLYEEVKETKTTKKKRVEE